MKTARVLVKRHRGKCVALVFLPRSGGSGRGFLHRAPATEDAWSSAATGKRWAFIHGFKVTHVLYEHGLVGPAAVGTYTVEAQ